MSATTPVFATAYAELPAVLAPSSTDSDAKNTTDPRAFASIGRNARVVR